MFSQSTQSKDSSVWRSQFAQWSNEIKKNVEYDIKIVSN